MGLLELASFIEMIKHRQGFKVACLEEIAFNQGCLDIDFIVKQVEAMRKNGYGQYTYSYRSK